MSEWRTQTRALLRMEFAQEAETGFSKLTRIPGTRVIRFLDYFTGLDTAEREALLDTLAHFNSASFFPELAGTEALERQKHPVFGRFMEAMAFRGFGGGYRYTPVKLLAGLAKDTAAGGLEGWIKSMGFSGLALQPRKDLLPNLDCLQPATAARLRKLLDAAFAGSFAPQKLRIASDHTRYAGVFENIGLKVDVLFPPKPLSPKQLDYQLIVAPAPDFAWNYASYESLWSLPASWDYLTEENAPRSIELLTELITYLTGLAARVYYLRRH